MKNCATIAHIHNMKKVIHTVRTIVVSQDNYVLLLVKSHMSRNPGKYEFPGGSTEGKFTSDPLEFYKRNAIRELWEETGLKAEEKDLKFIESFVYTPDHKDLINNRQVYIFLLRLTKDHTMLNIVLAENENHEYFVWIKLTELNNLYKNGKLSLNSSHYQKALNSRPFPNNSL